ncbi:endopeptidase La [Planctomycetota bacterium]|nr:endopeptidase La [Planctomycetota bacterium]
MARKKTPLARKKAPSARKKAPLARKKTSKRKTQRRSKRSVDDAEIEELVIVPVRNMILFPGVVLPLMLGRESSVLAVRAAVEDDRPIGLLLQRDERDDSPGPSDLFKVGTVGEIMRYWTAPDGRHQAICQGLSRFEVIDYVETEPLLVARVRRVEEVEQPTRAIEARFVALKQRAEEVLSLSPGTPEDLEQAVQGIDSPGMLADLVATFLDMPSPEKQEILETFEVKARLDRLLEALGQAAAVLELSLKIRRETKGSLDQAQREYFLREQLRQIRRELGEGDDFTDELAEIRERVDALDLPEEAEREVRRELRRLERTPEQAGEHSMLRTWMEVFTELPWNERSKDTLQLDVAQQVLDADHHGLEKVKRRILEFLAVKKLNPEGQGPTLCLVGPPGVGKTSLGQSVARAMGREFVRVSLGGVHDESEIRGHRRTYVGAMPGKIIEGLRKARTRNPVFLLDEVDKLGAGLHGDPSSALLEVLDPAQNGTFQDNYLGVPFDLSEVLFIATANVEEQIPGPLHDRMDVLRLSGYTEAEKLAIARKHLLARQRSAAGLKPGQLKVSVAALREVITGYTREAGVRGLERQIAAICRHAAVKFASRRRKPLTIGPDEVKEILGHERRELEVAERTAQSGVATGLAWTSVGGEILFIEAAASKGKGELRLTGQLGDVMKESALAALTLLKSRAADLGIDAEELGSSDVHLHIPAGAVPKDGPSAGVAITVALASLFTDRPVRGTVAMTGEISLRGRVLPVGGVKEKVLAALAAGIRTILLPERNMADLVELPEVARQKLEFIPLHTIDDAFDVALGRHRS